MAKPTDIIDSKMPPFLAAHADNPLDTALKDFKEFAGHVVSFGACDGFCTITACQDGDSTANGLADGWNHYPPHHYLEVFEDGTVIDQIEEYQAELLKPFEPELMEDDLQNLSIKWVVECKSGMVCEAAKYDVACGFWTRIISSSMQLAIQKTISLWEEESKKQIKSEERYINYESYLISRMRDDKSLDPILEALDEELPNSYTTGKTDQKILDLFSFEQILDILDYATKYEKDIKLIREAFGDKFDYTKAILFQNKMKKEERKFLAGKSSGMRYNFDTMREWWEIERVKTEEFLESLKKSESDKDK